VKTHLGCLVLLAALLPAAGCSLTSDHFSCAVMTGGALVRCVDYEQVGVQFRTTVEALCRGTGGDFSIDNTCPQETKLGGCKTEGNGYVQTSWYYPDSIVKTPSEVAGRCGGKEYFVDPSGTPTTPTAADMSMTSADR
jgi:hypothetical protein